MSLAACRGNDRAPSAEMELDEGVWCPRELCTELAQIFDPHDTAITQLSHSYHTAITLLHLGAAPTLDHPDEDDEGLHELWARNWT